MTCSTWFEAEWLMDNYLRSISNLRLVPTSSTKFSIEAETFLQLTRTGHWRALSTLALTESVQNDQFKRRSCEKLLFAWRSEGSAQWVLLTHKKPNILKKLKSLFPELLWFSMNISKGDNRALISNSNAITNKLLAITIGPWILFLLLAQSSSCFVFQSLQDLK